jgi:hypothetical protein
MGCGDCTRTLEQKAREIIITQRIREKGSSGELR